MKDIRNLLLDCRSALRRANLRSQDELRDRLEAALLDFSKQQSEESGKAEELSEPQTRTAQQVAYAWQIAARTLRISHPELHNTLVERVHAMLNANLVHDPGTELLHLQTKLDGAAAELAVLREQLAEAVPLLGRDAIGSDTECAQRRLRKLIDAANSGGGLPAHVDDNPVDGSHSREELQAVALGKRQLSRWERAWCVAEALVMTGRTPEQLQALDDPALVKLVLAGQQAASSP
jgi:hypothetical protein